MDGRMDSILNNILHNIMQYYLVEPNFIDTGPKVQFSSVK